MVSRFGHPLAASINGLKCKLDWGKVDAKRMPDNDSAKTKDVALIKSIRTGAWTSVSVTLDGFPPNQLGFVRVHDLTQTGIQLNN